MGSILWEAKIRSTSTEARYRICGVKAVLLSAALEGVTIRRRLKTGRQLKKLLVWDLLFSNQENLPSTL